MRAYPKGSEGFPLDCPLTGTPYDAPRLQRGLVMRSISLSIALLATLGLTTLAGQTIAPGDTVRVLAPHDLGGPLVGTLVALDHDSLTVQDRTGTLRLSRASVARLEVRRGSKSNLRSGAGFGGLAGFVLGLLISRSDCERSPWPADSQASCMLFIAGGFAGFGGGVGAVVGALTRSARWFEISPDELSIGVGPVLKGGVRFQLSIAF